MTTSSGSATDPLDELLSAHPGVPETITTPDLPTPHPAEADEFARHDGVPGHDQDALRSARILFAGAGGLNGLTALGLLKSGATHETITDPDLVERTNLPRQVFLAGDLGRSKAIQLARNLAPHAVGAATITGIPSSFETAVTDFAVAADLLIVGVDNNRCRLHCVHWARRHAMPAVFTMLSRDGMRTHSFLQGPNPADPCLWCALPNLDPEGAAPCASAIVSSCLQAAAFAVFFAHRALMGWPPGVFFNWREADLLGRPPEQTGVITQRPDCPICSPSAPRRTRTT